MSGHGPTPPAPRRRPGMLWLMLFAAALVLVPFLFWHGTWFGRSLTDAQIGEYLENPEKPRRIQHALSQIADRIVVGDPSMAQWYPRVVALASSPVAEIRVTAAWVMGQDNRSQQFHQALVQLVQDPEPMVRRNAALSLVRFGDGRGKPVLVQMLQPLTVTAPSAGVLSLRQKEQDAVDVGSLLARVSGDAGEPVDVRSPVAGQIRRRLQEDGARVTAGEPVFELESSAEQVWESLRALYLAGDPEDLPDVERFARSQPGMPERVRQQARITAQAIRRRARSGPSAR